MLENPLHGQRIGYVRVASSTRTRNANSSMSRSVCSLATRRPVKTGSVRNWKGCRTSRARVSPLPSSVGPIGAARNRYRRSRRPSYASGCRLERGRPPWSASLASVEKPSINTSLYRASFLHPRSSTLVPARQLLHTAVEQDEVVHQLNEPRFRTDLQQVLVELVARVVPSASFQARNIFSGIPSDSPRSLTRRRPRPTSVVSHRQVRILPVGIVRASDDSCNNAPCRRSQCSRAQAGTDRSIFCTGRDSRTNVNPMPDSQTTRRPGPLISFSCGAVREL